MYTQFWHARSKFVYEFLHTRTRTHTHEQHQQINIDPYMYRSIYEILNLVQYIYIECRLRKYQLLILKHRLAIKKCEVVS